MTVDDYRSLPDPSDTTEYALVAVKRDWVPEWLFRLCKPVGIYQPFRWVLTRKP